MRRARNAVLWGTSRHNSLLEFLIGYGRPPGFNNFLFDPTLPVLIHFPVLFFDHFPSQTQTIHEEGMSPAPPTLLPPRFAIVDVTTRPCIPRLQRSSTVMCSTTTISAVIGDALWTIYRQNHLKCATALYRQDNSQCRISF